MANWDAKYAAAPDGLFGSEPNQYVRQVVARSDFKARSGLCLADGDGRNSRWLAQHGLTMAAVDLSGVAVVNGTALDLKAGVHVERRVADLEIWRPSLGQSFEVVFLMYLQAPMTTRMAALKVGWQALSAGGWFVLEGFAKAQAAGEAGPGDPDLLYALEEVQRALPDALIMEAMTGRVRLDEGGRHQGLAEVVRFAARKV
jgi:Methyltransferase domain